MYGEGLVDGGEPLLEAFPFHWEVDDRLTLTRAGASLVRMLERSPVGERLADVFEFIQPETLAYEEMLEAKDRVVTLRCKHSTPCVLKGQLVPGAARETVLFIGWPWLTRPGELGERAQFLVQLTNGALDDARELASRLQRRSQSLAEANVRLAAEIEERRLAEAALRRHVERTARQQEALLRLAASTELPWNERLRAVLRGDSDTIDVSRVSYWQIARGGEAIRCEALFRSDTGAFESGLELSAKDFPSYFGALRTGAVIVANEANVDPSTREFSESYLKPSGIGAMMDVPVYVRGALTGVICHEHVGGVRSWTADEQQFAISIGQMLSLAIESEDRRRAEQALRESEARFRAIAQVSPVPLIVNSVPDGVCLWGNTAASLLSGLPEDQLVGKAAPDFYADPADRSAILAELAEKGFVEAREVRLKRADGSEYWAQLSIRPVELDGKRAAIVGLTDLSPQKRMEDALRHTALHDSLTGLPNRVVLFDILRREIGRAQRNAAYKFAVLFLDLDGFKTVNDTLGHDAGDRVLVTVSERLRACMRPMDAVSRLGGDEFAVVVADVKDEAEANRVASRIRAALSAPQKLVDGEHVIGASIGVVLGDARHTDPSALLREADLAMYKEKSLRHAAR